MLLTQSPKFNKNYAAKIIEVKDFLPHPNPKCERLKCCSVDGYSIAVSIDTNPGLYIYFPVECAIASTYLSANNLYREKSKNVNPEQSGFFEENGRVKMIRLQGYPSEGFIMPLESIYTWITDTKEETPRVGTEFDSVDGLVLCTKYIPKVSRTSGTSHVETSKGKRNKKRLNKVIDEQFRFHYDTTLIKKCPNVLHPDDLISITAKVHGTSGISAYVLCKTPVYKSQKVACWINNNIVIPVIRLFGGHYVKEVITTEYYDYLWSSRSVVKNPFYNEHLNEGFYNCDVWGEAHKIIQPFLQKGMTIYYEIVGFLPNGGYIQKNYDYGYTPELQTSNESKYTYGVNFGIQVYRITYTNPDGRVYEFSARQVQQWCIKQGLRPVEQYYYGYAKDLYPDIATDEHWNEEFLKRLSEDKNFYMEELSPLCQNEVPHEGLVIKIENNISEAYKLKCIKFLERETKSLDKGEVDIETEA